MNEQLKALIEDLRCELEEANESGDLEERMELSLRIDQLEKLLLMHRQRGTQAGWLECGLCKGAGKHEEYKETWPCNSCKGVGGSYT